jgi:DNA-binding MarR family transcriptional regulator
MPEMRSLPEGVRLTELAAGARVTKQSMAAVIERLESRGAWLDADR